MAVLPEGVPLVVENPFAPWDIHAAPRVNPTSRQSLQPASGLLLSRTLSMPTSNDIFSRMPPAVASQLFSHLHEKEKPLYKATIETLAKQRNLRPVFIERKPREERFAWMREMAAKKQNQDVAAHLLQIWFVGAHSKLLCDFLDALGIAHDENGTIEEMPEAPSKEALAKAIDECFRKHDAKVVAVYLNAFQALDEEGWPTLGELLAEDPRLRL